MLESIWDNTRSYRSSWTPTRPERLSWLVKFRHNALKKQRKHNYQLEYDRIRSVLGQNLVPNTTRSMIQNRMKDLEELGARAVNKLPN
jgi:hypothetical protein